MLTKISAFSRQRKKNKYTELQKQEVSSKPESDYRTLQFSAHVSSYCLFMCPHLPRKHDSPTIIFAEDLLSFQDISSTDNTYQYIS